MLEAAYRLTSGFHNSGLPMNVN